MKKYSEYKMKEYLLKLSCLIGVVFLDITNPSP